MVTVDSTEQLFDTAPSQIEFKRQHVGYPKIIKTSDRDLSILHDHGLGGTEGQSVVVSEDYGRWLLCAERLVVA